MHRSITPILFTKDAYAEMQDRLSHLTQLRGEVVERLKIAREMGDLSENGAYRYAKFELGNIGREMKRLQYLLSQGKVAEVTNTNEAGFGSTVTLQTAEKIYEFTLVSEHESNPQIGKLSLKSPLGRMLVGKNVGDTVSVESPRGKIVYTLLKIS